MRDLDLLPAGTTFDILHNGFEPVSASKELAAPIDDFISTWCDDTITLKVEFYKTKTSREFVGSTQIVAQTSDLFSVAINLAVLGYETRKKALDEVFDKGRVKDGGRYRQISKGLLKVHRFFIKTLDAANELLQAEQRRAVLWWKQKASRTVQCACFSMNYRHTTMGVRGLPTAHVDATSVAEWFTREGSEVSQQWFERAFEMPMSTVLKHIALTYNIWVNAGSESILHLPLMVLDTQTFDLADRRAHNLQQGLKSMLVGWSPGQRWYYRDLAKGEGYMFGTSPHRGPGGVTLVGTPHSAANFLRAKGKDPPPRESVELRCLVVDPELALDEAFSESDAKLLPTDEEMGKAVAATILAKIIPHAQFTGDGDALNT
mmetsp:Transcript_96439/g.272691  ORF Transcript_96439/g.272691 Transcript_96439/m.272691 type:complete len:375 (+) Transcript_96439:754-1878(+)